MSVVAGTIRSANLKSKANEGAGTTTRDLTEVWEVTADFGAYTGSTDTATILAVGAAISARVRDGRTRTILCAMPAYCGAEVTTNQPVLFGGTSVAALTVSTDDLTGQLNTINTAATEITSTAGTTFGVGIFVTVAVT